MLFETSPKALDNANTNIHKSTKEIINKNKSSANYSQINKENLSKTEQTTACCLQELLTGNVLSPGGSLTSKQLQRMVTALDLASDKGAEISALEADLVQAKSKALLYEVQSINQSINQSIHPSIHPSIHQSTFSVFGTHQGSQQTTNGKMTYTQSQSWSHGSRSSLAWPPC